MTTSPTIIHAQSFFASLAVFRTNIPSTDETMYSLPESKAGTLGLHFSDSRHDGKKVYHKMIATHGR
jgi:hypothetical protein